MAEKFSWTNPEFDHYVAEYDAALAHGLRLSGEDKNYFARERIAWLTQQLSQLGERPRHCLDFGCGVGSATPFLLGLRTIEQITSVDISGTSIALAQQMHGTEHVHFCLLDEYGLGEEIDLAFCNGVFHHLPLTERADAIDYVYRVLRPGGLFAFWENNPWNPGTRLVMSRISFDREAVTLKASEARRLLIAGGFAVLRTDFLFIFPRLFRWLRFLEPWITPLPLGAQYQILCRKPLYKKRGLSFAGKAGREFLSEPL